MTIEQFYELMDRAYDLPHSPEQVALLEEAVRLADSLNDERAGFEARMELIDAAEWSGFDVQAIVAFSWCLAYMDRNPDAVDEGGVMWRYKWILCSVCDNDAIAKQQIRNMVEDFERRCHVSGWSIRSAHYLRWKTLSIMGELKEALPSYELWQTTPRDDMSDCAACELDSQITFKLRFGEQEEAVELAKPILNGKMTCSDVPAITYANLLNPLTNLNRAAEAQEIHNKGLPLVANDGHHLAPLTDHLLYLIKTGDLSKALTVFQRHVPLVAASRIPFSRFFFFLASWRLMEKLSQAESRHKTRKLSIPRELSCYREDHTYDLAALSEWFGFETRQLADKFNQRNGNDYFNKIIEQNAQAATYK